MCCPHLRAHCQATVELLAQSARNTARGPGLAGLSGLLRGNLVTTDSRRGLGPIAEAINPNANPRDARHHSRSESGSYE